jgi:beta-xylosidase
VLREFKQRGIPLLAKYRSGQRYGNMIPSLLSTILMLAGIVSSSPLERLETRDAMGINAAIPQNFPDPSILQDADGIWYSFSTNNKPSGANVPVARAPAPSGPWTYLSNDLLPTPGSWSNGQNVWAPDVRKISSTYVLYYTAASTQETTHHCVGAAIASTILGPYTAINTPIACPLSQGGAIDPSGFTDTDGTHYVVYKVDGNSIGHGGDCNNGVAPIVSTPLMLQQLAEDGVTPVGNPVELLDRSDADGPLIEAPNLLLYEGVYFLFFSSNCYTSPDYDVSYAVASSVKGPFTKSCAPLMVTNNPFALTSPGGATSTVDGKNLVFHGNCAAGRCMFQSGITIAGEVISMGGPSSQSQSTRQASTQLNGPKTSEGPSPTTSRLLSISNSGASAYMRNRSRSLLPLIGWFV